MPRAKLPPTPTTSTGPTAQDRLVDMESAFALPPAAINQSPPTSPVFQRKRTLSGSTKNKEELPPPPSRARKIIQMKPKEDPAAPTTPTTVKSASPKRKQPSATSAAGRKIARKTAHSIIERRRRSKMNEEFGVLKDMIPACKGVEMHKLAILQAGIEYVRYLQGCVDKLQDERKRDYRKAPDDQDMEDSAATARTPSASPLPEALSHRPSSVAATSTSTATTTSAQPSPEIRPNGSSSGLANQRQLPPPTATTKTYSTSPPPLIAQTPAQTGVSPAFNAIHFSPDLSRTFSRPQSSQCGQYAKQSPNILPLPQAAMPVSAPEHHQHHQHQREVHAEAAATAALMMLTNDRRSTTDGSGRGGGMSVRDLLSH